MTEVNECLRQGDARWRSEILGFGPTTFGLSACTLFCLDEARHRLLKVANDPIGLNTIGRQKKLFSRYDKATNKYFVGEGSLANIPGLAKEARLACGPVIAGDLGVMRAAIVEALLRGNAAVMFHVDHDSARPGGDIDPEHYTLGVTLGVDGRIAYTDPATGKIGHLGLASLSAPSGWRDQRVYSVRGLRVLTALQ